VNDSERNEDEKVRTEVETEEGRAMGDARGDAGEQDEDWMCASVQQRQQGRETYPRVGLNIVYWTSQGLLSHYNYEQ